METLYFMMFCLAIAYVIFWSLKNDDLADFDGEDEASGKFKPGKPVGTGKQDRKEKRN